MGFFDLFKQSNINQGIEEYKRTDDAVLLDVRTPQEYQEGHNNHHGIRNERCHCADLHRTLIDSVCTKPDNSYGQ